MVVRGACTDGKCALDTVEVSSPVFPRGTLSSEGLPSGDLTSGELTIVPAGGCLKREGVIEVASYALIALIGARLLWTKGRGFFGTALDFFR